MSTVNEFFGGEMPRDNMADAPDDKPLIPPRVRRWVYGIVNPATKLLVAYGIVTEAKGALWAGLAFAVLGDGVAFLNRPQGD